MLGDQHTSTASDVAPSFQAGVITVYGTPEGETIYRASWGQSTVWATVLVNFSAFVAVHVEFAHKYGGVQAYYYYTSLGRRMWSQLPAALRAIVWDAATALYEQRGQIKFPAQQAPALQGDELTVRDLLANDLNVLMRQYERERRAARALVAKARGLRHEIAQFLAGMIANLMIRYDDAETRLIVVNRTGLNRLVRHYYQARGDALEAVASARGTLHTIRKLDRQLQGNFIRNERKLSSQSD
jgi:hypothetical protein